MRNKHLMRPHSREAFGVRRIPALFISSLLLKLNSKVPIGFAAVYITISLLLFPGRAISNAQTTNTQSTNVVSRFDYSAFRIINDRNIFNPRRSARNGSTERTTTRRSTPRSDSFALVGTMSYAEKGPLAFFDGSSSDYRKVLKQNDTIAGFKLTEIEASHVKLASPTNELELRVGMQLSHDEDGTWHVADRAETVTPRTVASSVAPRTGTNRPSPVIGRSNVSSATNTLAGITPGTPPDSAELQEPTNVPEPAAAPAGSPDDVLERLRQRAAAERGENPP
jgi:hypothetical protein